MNTSTKSLPYQKAGRLIRIFGWFSLIPVIGIALGIIVPAIANQQMPEPTMAFFTLFALIPYMFFKVGSAIIEHKVWGRIAGTALGFLFLPGFPIGTLIGIIVLIYLFFGWHQDAS